MAINPLITRVRQIGIVVSDIDATVRDYADTFGVGPWGVWTYGPKNLSNMRVRGVPQPYSMRVAIAWTKDFMWELIQPLEGPSIYREFLDHKGEGMHHVLVDHSQESFEQAVEDFRRRGSPPLMEGHMIERGIDFAYIESDGPLKALLEISHVPADSQRPPPDYWYPHAVESHPDEANARR